MAYSVFFGLFFQRYQFLGADQCKVDRLGLYFVVMSYQITILIIFNICYLCIGWEVSKKVRCWLYMESAIRTKRRLKGNVCMLRHTIQYGLCSKYSGYGMYAWIFCQAKSYLVCGKGVQAFYFPPSHVLTRNHMIFPLA